MDIRHHMVRRRNNDIGSRISLLDSPAHIADARSRVPATRLSKDLGRIHFRQLFPDIVSIILRCDHPHILNGYDSFETVESKLNERTPTAEYIEELFGFGISAHRPETAAYTAGHNYQKIILVHFHLQNE